MNGTPPDQLLRLRDLRVEFARRRAAPVAAVRGVDLDVTPGSSHGLVGESGSGKTVTALAAIGLLDRRAKVSGEISWRGNALDSARPEQWSGIRGSGITMMFQDARASLNPARSVRSHLDAVLRLHGDADTRSRDAEGRALLDRVQLADADRILNSHPGELSGGMAQRVALALALACRPQLLIADEPTAALDPTVAVAIVALLREVQRDSGLAMLVISHDMNVVRALCDHTSVMQEGRIVERRETAAMFDSPSTTHAAELIDASRWRIGRSDAE